MICIKKLLMQHPWTSETIPGQGPNPGGYIKSFNMWTLYVRWKFFLHCQVKSLKGLLLQLGCLFFSSWHYLKHSSICMTGQVLKIGNIYTYQEGGYVDIVRLLDVHTDKGYVYCTLFFFTRNKIVTVSQILQPGAYVIWQLKDDKEYDEIMSMKLWQEVDKQNDLLEFGY